MNALLAQADAILRAASKSRNTTEIAPSAVAIVEPLPLLRLLLLSVGCQLFYGAVMGTFGGLGDGRWLQIAFSSLKVPLLLGVTFGLSAPSFFVLNTLLGLRDDFAQTMRALLCAQVGTALVLAALAPFTMLWYASFSNYNNAILFNALAFGVASLCGQRLLAAFYRPLIQRDVRHRKLLLAWLVVFAIVAIQMAWLLRPFVGDPQQPVAFFRHGAWSNAYETVGRMIWRALFR